MRKKTNKRKAPIDSNTTSSKVPQQLSNVGTMFKSMNKARKDKKQQKVLRDFVDAIRATRMSPKDKNTNYLFYYEEIKSMIVDLDKDSARALLKEEPVRIPGQPNLIHKGFDVFAMLTAAMVADKFSAEEYSKQSRRLIDHVIEDKNYFNVPFMKEIEVEQSDGTVKSNLVPNGNAINYITHKYAKSIYEAVKSMRQEARLQGETLERTRVLHSVRLRLEEDLRRLTMSIRWLIKSRQVDPTQKDYKGRTPKEILFPVNELYDGNDDLFKLISRYDLTVLQPSELASERDVRADTVNGADSNSLSHLPGFDIIDDADASLVAELVRS